jgi:hypothetical protein
LHSNGKFDGLGGVTANRRFFFGIFNFFGEFPEEYIINVLNMK